MIPILFEPVDRDRLPTWLASVPFLPEDGRPLSDRSGPELDEAMDRVAEQVARQLAQVVTPSPTSSVGSAESPASQAASPDPAADLVPIEHLDPYQFSEQARRAIERRGPVAGPSRCVPCR